MFMTIATLIAAVAILVDSPMLVVGAMVVGPEFGPLAGVAVALVQRRRALARRSLIALLVGFAVAIVVAYAGTEAMEALGLVSRGAAHERGAAADRLHVEARRALVPRRAYLAGTAGMLSLTTRSRPC